MEKKITVLELKDYLNRVGIRAQVLADMSGVNRSHLNNCLSGRVDRRDGTVFTLSSKKLDCLQEALHQLSIELKYIFIFYNTDREVVKRNGRRYCPDCVDQIKSQLSRYMNIIPFVQFALGWNYSKARNIMDIQDSMAYGNITSDDCDRINNALSGLAGMLDAFTLVNP